MNHFIRRAVLLAAMLGLGSPGWFQVLADEAACRQGHAPAEAVTVDGTVMLERPGAVRVALERGSRLCPGDLVLTGDEGRVELRFAGLDTTVGLTANTRVRIPEPSAPEDLTLLGGLIRFISSVRGAFEIGSRHANAGIDGTEAVLALGPAGGLLVLVREGDVRLAASTGDALRLGAGEAGFAAPGGSAVPAEASTVPSELAPLVIDPDGASDWAVYYPPILLAGEAGGAAVTEAAARLVADDPDGAESLLAAEPRTGRDGAAAAALSALVAVRQNRVAEAQAAAAEAVALADDLGAAHIARSYAEQAAGEVDRALGAAERAVSSAPGDAFAWARLGELRFTVGDRLGAEAAARRSRALRPTMLAEAILGLSALSARRDGAAFDAFDRAIALDDSAPLPRLGKGLAYIRIGEVAAGRRELELAASLDPRRADLRTWLGRAYQVEGLPEKALASLDLALARDPDSPTPLLYKAAALDAQNRPGAALDAIREAEARAEGRAVLRSERGLAEDRAVLASAVGRALDRVGFTEQALEAGARAAEADPGNAGAHRVLTDLHAGLPELVFARSGASLKARLLADPSRAPVDPTESEPDLALLDPVGPARASFGEYAPFYVSDGVSARATVLAGTQSTFSDTVSLKALSGRVSLGIGQHHYRTDGYRTNNDVRHNVEQIEVKVAVTPELTLLAEYGRRDTRAGDRSLEFDFSEVFATSEEIDRRNRFRLGLHGRIGANQDVLAVATARTRDFSLDDGIGLSQLQIDSEGVDFQLQHIGRFGPLTTTIGASHTTIERTRTTDINTGPPVFLVGRLAEEFNEQSFSLYGYAQMRHAVDVGLPLVGELTLGASADVLSSPGRIEEAPSSLNPKAGLRLTLDDRVSLRLAYAETVTPDLLFEDRLEPVTVAGLAQFRPEAAGSKVAQAEIGLEARLTPDLTVGAVATGRRIGEAVADFLDAEADERELAAYAHIAFTPELFGRLRASYLDIDSTLPDDLVEYELTSLGGELRYLHPSGFFASGGTRWVDFRERRTTGANEDSFFLGQIAVGYRLPEDRGVLSLEIGNILDTNFSVVERPIRALAGDTVLDPVFPRDFTAIARATFGF